MKVLIFLSGYFLATLAQSVIVLNDINNIPICATFNNVNKTFINIWQIYDEFKTTGQIWTPVTTGACPQNNIDCSVLNPVCAVSSNNFFKTFPNRCVLETEQKTTGTVWNVVFNGICFVNQDDTYSTSPMLAKIYPAISPASSDYKKVLVPSPASREPIQQYSTPSYGTVPSPSAVNYNPATQKLHSPQYPPPHLGPNNKIPVNYNPAPTPQPYAPSLIPGNYNQSVDQVPDVHAPLTLYSPAAIDTSKVYNSTTEPSTYTVSSSNSDNNYQAPPSTFAAPSPDPVPVKVDPLPVPDEYSPALAPQTYSSVDKIPSCHEPLPLPSYPTYLQPHGNYSKSVEEVKAPLSLYSSPTIETFSSHEPEVQNYPPEPLPPTTYTVTSPNSNISSSYLSHSNYTVLSPDDVTTKVNPLHVAVVYNTAPTPQTYGPDIEIPSSDYNPSPVPGHYNPEPLPSPSYPVPSHIPENYNQPVKQFPEVQASLPLYSSPSINTVSKPINEVYSSPPEPLPPATYTVPSPTSGSYYQAPAPVPSPSYIAPSNYSVLSRDPVPTIVDPLPVPVDYNTAPNPKTYAPANEIPSSGYSSSPVPGHYNPELLPSPSYPVPSHIPENYNQPVVQVLKAQDPLPLYSSPFIDTVSTPATDIYNLPPEPQPPAINTVASPISDSYYQAPAPVPSPSYLSPSNYTLPSPDPVPTIVDPLPVPVDYNTASTPQPYAPAVKTLSCDHIASPVPGSYNPEPLYSSSYPAPSHVAGHYNQPVVQVPEEQAPLSLYSPPSINSVPRPLTNVYNSPPKPLPPSTYKVPSPISDSYYQAPEPVPSPSYLLSSNYTVLSPDPVSLPVPVDYNTAPNPQSYAPAVEIPSSDYNLSPVRGHYTPEPLPSPPYPVPSPIQGNYNQPVKQVPEVEASLSLYSSPSYDTVSTPPTDIYKLPQEPVPPATYTVPSPTSGSYYQAPAPVPSPSYLSPSNYTVFSPDPVPAIVDPLPVPVDYSTASKPQSYAPAIKILSCDHISSPTPGSYNPEPLHLSSYPAPSSIPGNYNQPVEHVPKEQAPLSLYSSPSVDTVPTPVTDDYNSPPESLPLSTYTVPSPISDSFYQAAAPVPSPSYLSPSNYTLISPDPVPLPVPVDYNTAPNPQSYAPAVEIPSSDYNLSPVPGHYTPEPLPSPPYPVPSPIQGNYNQPVKQVPKVEASLSLYSSPSYDTVSTPPTDIYKLPQEPVPPATYTVPSPTSGSYYQAPAPVPSPSYLSPSNYIVFSPDPVPAIVDPLPVPVDYSTASKPQSYAPAIKILSCDHISSPTPGSYNPEPLHLSSYPAPSSIPGNYNQPVEHVPKEQAPLSLYSSPSVDTVPTPVTDDYNSPPESLPLSTYTVPSPISDSFYQAAAPVPSPSYLSPSNYTLISPDPVPLPVPVDYNTAPNPQSYAPAVEIPSSDYNLSPVPGHYTPEPLPSPPYPVPSPIQGNYNQPVKQVPKVEASLSLYSSPSYDTVSTPPTDIYKLPQEPVPPATYTVPSPTSGSYYQAPAPVPSPSYIAPSNYSVLSRDPVPTKVDPLPVPVDYSTSSKPQLYAPAIEIPSCDHSPSTAPGPYNPKTHIAAQELPPSSTYPVPYNEVSASDNVHSPAPYSAALDPLALPSYSVPSSNPSDYVLGNYNSAPQTYYLHNVSSAGTVNSNPDSAAASPVPDPYNPFTEPPAAPSYPSPSPIPLYEPILSDPVPHYLNPLPASTTPPAVNNQYTTSATHSKYSNPSVSNPVSNAYALSDSDKIPYQPVPNYKQSSNIYSASSEQPYNSVSAVTPSPSHTYQQLSNTTYSPPETSNAYAEESSPDVGSCSNVETFSSPVLDYQNIPLYSQIYKAIPLAGKNYSDKPNKNNIIKSHLANQSYDNANPSTSHDKPKVYNEAKIEHSRQSANNDGQTIYNGVVYQGPYYYIPKYKHINYGNFNFLPSQNMSPAPVPFAPAIPALVSAYPYVGTPFSGYSTNPFEQLLKQLQYIATKN